MLLDKNWAMEKLFVWSEGYKQYVPQKGVPPSTESLIMDEKGGYPGNWSLYDHIYHGFPSPPDYKLPEYLYFQVPGNYRVEFDYLGWNGKLKVVSEDFFHYLKEHGVNDGYEIAKIKEVVNRSGRTLETKPYYALRFGVFDDHLLDFHSETKKRAVGMQGMSALYPDMSIKDGVKKKIFVLSEPVYDNALIFTESIKNDIKRQKFVGPIIYPMTEFHIAYNGK